MADVGISFVFKTSTAAFTRGVAAAENSVRGLKKSFRDFDVGPGFKQLLGVGGVLGGFRAAINGAQDLRSEFEKMGKAIPESVRSVAELGDNIDRLKRGTLELGITALSTFTRWGEAIGGTINRLRGISEEQEKIREASARAADEEERQAQVARERDKSRRAAAEQSLAGAEAKRKQLTQSPEEVRAERKGRMLELAKERSGVLADSTRAKEIDAELAKLENEVIEDAGKQDQDATRAAEQKKRADEAAAAEAERIKRGRLNKVAPTVEELAAQETGGFVAGDDPRLRARQTLQLEERARILGQRGDIKGALDLQSKADQMRAGLENATATSQVLTPQAAKTAFEEALTKTNEELAAVKEALGGIIKAQK